MGWKDGWCPCFTQVSTHGKRSRNSISSSFTSFIIFLIRARDCTTFTLHDLADFYVESVTAHHIKINDYSYFHNRWPNWKTKLKWKHLWERGGPWCFGALHSLRILRKGRIGSANMHSVSFIIMHKRRFCRKNFQGFKVQGFFICHIIVIQGITRSEMQSNQVRSVTVQNNKNTNYISNITQGHTYGKKRRNKNKMCNEIKKCKTIRCAKNNKMCKRQWDVQKTMRCAKKRQDVQKKQ